MSNVGFRCGERDPRCWSSWFVVAVKLSMLGRGGRWVFRRWSWWRCRCWLESVVHPVVTWRRYVVLPVCAVLAWAHCLSPFWLEFTVRRSSSCCRGGRGAGTLCFPYVPSWRGFVACPRAARLALEHCSSSCCRGGRRFTQKCSCSRFGRLACYCLIMGIPGEYWLVT